MIFKKKQDINGSVAANVANTISYLAELAKTSTVYVVFKSGTVANAVKVRLLGSNSEYFLVQSLEAVGNFRENEIFGVKAMDAEFFFVPNSLLS